MSPTGRVLRRAPLLCEPRLGRRIEALEVGTEVECLARETWLAVRAGDREGFVRAEALEMLDPDPGADERERGGATFGGLPLRVAADFQPALARIEALGRRFGLALAVRHCEARAIEVDLVVGSLRLTRPRLTAAGEARLPLAARRFIAALRAEGLAFAAGRIGQD